MKNKKIIAIFIIALIVVSIPTVLFINNKPNQKNEPIKYSIQRSYGNNCKFSYEKLCFNIPDDYKCVGNNKCQLSTDKDMLLVQVYLDENYEEDINTFIKSGKNGFSRNLENIEEKELNGNIWKVAKVKTQNTKYYFIKINKNVYSIKILSKRDSGGKFDELTSIVENSVMIK